MEKTYSQKSYSKPKKEIVKEIKKISKKVSRKKGLDHLEFDLHIPNDVPISFKGLDFEFFWKFVIKVNRKLMRDKTLSTILEIK